MQPIDKATPGELACVESAIAHMSKALSLVANGDLTRPLLLARLARFHMKRFELLEEPNDATKVIEYTTSSLALTPDDDPRVPGLLDTLGEAYGDRFKRLGEPSDGSEAIKYGSLAIALTPEGHPSLPDRLGALGVSYYDRFERLGELHDLGNAIINFSSALALTPADHSSLPYRLYTLGASCGVRFQRLGDLDDIEKMIEYTSRSVNLTPDDDPHISTRLENLGTAYLARFERVGNLDDLDKSLKHRSRAVALVPKGHPDMPARLANLAGSHTRRFKRLGELDDLDKAIEYGSRAISLASTGHPHFSVWYSNLGVSHSVRFRRLGELDDLEKAIECQTRALDLTPDDHPLSPHMLDTLGVSYNNRFGYLGRVDDLERAIHLQSRGLALTPSDHPSRSGRLANIASPHIARFKQLGDPSDLEKAIKYEACALASTPEGHPQLTNRLNNLGETYYCRYKHLGRLDDLDTAVEYHSRALAFTPDGHPDLSRLYNNIATLHVSRFDRTGDTSHLQTALRFFRQATQSARGSPRDMYISAAKWAGYASEYSPLDPLEAYQTAINLLPQFVWLGATANQRYEDLKRAESLAVCAAAEAVRYSRYELALEWLEHARCVVWHQSLMLRSPLDELRSSHPDLADRLRTISAQLLSASSEREESQEHSVEEVAQKHHRLAKEYNQLQDQARSLPRFEDFLRPMKATSLTRAAKTGPVVVINCHKDQCEALLILPRKVQVHCVPLPDFSHELAQYVRVEMRKALARNGLRERRPYFARQSREDSSIEDALRLVWYGIVRPILDYLGFMDNASTPDLPHITWCPTGPISFLPLHAAGDYDHPESRVYNYVVSSYTPTLTALLSSSPVSSNSNPKVLGICQEATPGHSPLPGTKKELEQLKTHTQKLAQYTPLVNRDATPAAVLDAMEQHDWVHLACHAHQNVGNATESGFFLQGGTLTLSIINGRSFKNKGLAFLSACQTAKGDENLPDEAVHLASGMLMAGYASVIGTMWSVHDDDAPLVADKVYEQLMKEGKVGNGEAGKALHYAVAELRDRVGEKEFGRWVPYIHIGS